MTYHREYDERVAGWVDLPSVQKLFEATRGINREGDAFCLVGGSVRDMLLGIPPADIDLATPLQLNRLTAALDEAGVRYVDHGVRKGTVVVPFPEGKVEITCFHGSWTMDTNRRDFTINAMRVDQHGFLYDHHGGLRHLEEGIVRFVASARHRIREDPLRILRLFRFHAWYGKNTYYVDSDALGAILSHTHLLGDVPGERIRGEMLRLLLAPNPVPMLQLMFNHQIMDYIIPPDVDILHRLGTLQRLVDVEQRLGEVDWVRRLAVMFQWI